MTGVCLQLCLIKPPVVPSASLRRRYFESDAQIITVLFSHDELR